MWVAGGSGGPDLNASLTHTPTHTLPAYLVSGLSVLSCLLHSGNGRRLGGREGERLRRGLAWHTGEVGYGPGPALGNLGSLGLAATGSWLGRARPWDAVGSRCGRQGANPTGRRLSQSPPSPGVWRPRARVLLNSLPSPCFLHKQPRHLGREARSPRAWRWTSEGWGRAMAFPGEGGGRPAPRKAPGMAGRGLG